MSKETPKRKPITSKIKNKLKAAYKIGTREINRIVKTVEAVFASHDAIYANCKALYEWAGTNQERRQLLIDLFVALEYHEGDAIARVDTYLKWGSGAINPDFFALPAGIRVRLKNFSDQNINVLMADPEVTFVKMDHAAWEYTECTTHYTTLSKEEFDSVFTKRGRNRTVNEQVTLLTREDPKTGVKVVNGQMHFQKGYYSADVLMRHLETLLMTETSARKNASHQKKLAALLAKTKKRGDAIGKMRDNKTG